MKTMILLIVFLLLFGSEVYAQVSINTDGTPPDSSAMLDVKSNNKGLLIPRLSQAQIKAILKPANGLVVFCTTDNTFYAYIESTDIWKEISFGTGTISPFPCGSSITINHMAGTVAPVNKTVTYGTVTNLPGELSKCWITSNLGANHAATAVDDSSEASSGWYWQFNTKQGYKHDGATRTPNTTWIISMEDGNDWLAINDPCKLELGSGWRIPAYSEWSNLVTMGNWTNWNDPWNSGLKLHAAGYLLDSDGSLICRGLGGIYWSSTSWVPQYGWVLNFCNNFLDLINFNVIYGFPLRCVRD